MREEDLEKKLDENAFHDIQEESNNENYEINIQKDEEIKDTIEDNSSSEKSDNLENDDIANKHFSAIFSESFKVVFSNIGAVLLYFLQSGLLYTFIGGAVGLAVFNMYNRIEPLVDTAFIDDAEFMFDYVFSHMFGVIILIWILILGATPVLWHLMGGLLKRIDTGYTCIESQKEEGNFFKQYLRIVALGFLFAFFTLALGSGAGVLVFMPPPLSYTSMMVVNIVGMIIGMTVILVIIELRVKNNSITQSLNNVHRNFFKSTNGFVGKIILTNLIKFVALIVSWIAIFYSTLIIGLISESFVVLGVGLVIYLIITGFIEVITTVLIYLAYMSNKVQVKT